MSKNKKYDLDIAILTAGRVDLFRKCVEAVLTQYQPNYQIHVHNNGHPSQEYEEIYKLLPAGSTIKRSNEMSGFGEGANKVINSGSAPLALFITDDIFIHDGAIETLLKTMEDKSIGQCGYKFMFPEDSVDPARPAGKVQHIGLASQINGNIIHPLIGWNPDHPKCNISRDVLAVTGASFMVRRDVFKQTGGFNPVYGRGYFEDVDLSLLIRALGFRIYIETQATATHGVGQTFKNLQQPINLTQNQEIFKMRWAGQIIWTEFLMW